jgi:hypothetical protein
MEFPVFGQPLNGSDRAPIRLHGEHSAGFHRLTIHQHGAGATESTFASDVSSGQSGDITDVVDEEGAGLDVIVTPLPVQT